VDLFDIKDFALRELPRASPTFPTRLSAELEAEPPVKRARRGSSAQGQGVGNAAAVRELRGLRFVPSTFLPGKKLPTGVRRFGEAAIKLEAGHRHVLIFAPGKYRVHNCDESLLCSECEEGGMDLPSFRAHLCKIVDPASMTPAAMSRLLNATSTGTQRSGPRGPARALRARTTLP
jgi:hypothetical protein